MVEIQQRMESGPAEYPPLSSYTSGIKRSASPEVDNLIPVISGDLQVNRKTVADKVGNHVLMINLFQVGQVDDRRTADLDKMRR